MLRYLYQKIYSLLAKCLMRFSLPFSTIIVIAQIVICSGKLKLKNDPK